MVEKLSICQAKATKVSIGILKVLTTKFTFTGSSSLDEMDTNK